ncbi:MAG: hypothetical protein AAFX85_07450, partial [Pseudomonadota bacterium]
DQHARGVPLKVMTRHLCGLFAGCYGARRWRRAMSDPALVARHGAGILRHGLTLVEEPAVAVSSAPQAIGLDSNRPGTENTRA